MCEICKQITCIPRCPNYVLPKSIYYCSLCGEGIYNQEEYIRNDKGEYAHYDCFYGMKDLLDWLECEIKTMEGNDNQNT